MIKVLFFVFFFSGILGGVLSVFLLIIGLMIEYSDASIRVKNFFDKMTEILVFTSFMCLLISLVFLALRLMITS